LETEWRIVRCVGSNHSTPEESGPVGRSPTADLADLFLTSGVATMLRRFTRSTIGIRCMPRFAALRSRPALLRLEGRSVPAIVSWDGGGGDLSWNNPLNWDTNLLPVANDEVIINIPAATPTITIAPGSTVSIMSVQCEENLTVGVGGSFSLTGVGLSSYVAGSFVAANANVAVIGNGTAQIPSFATKGFVDIDGAILNTSGGGSLTLLGATTRKGGTASIQAIGMGSVIDLSNLTSIVTSGGLGISAKAGGKVDLHSLVAASDDVPAWDRAVSFFSDGLGSTIDLSSFSVLIDQNPAFGISTLEATNSGAIISPQIKSLTNSAITLDGTGSIPISQITDMTNCVLTISTTSRTFPNLVGIDGTSMLVSGGATLSVPLAKTFTQPVSRNATLTATGVGSLLNLGNLESILTAGGVTFNAILGGQIELGKLVSVADDAPSWDRAVYFNADGNGSLIKLGSFTTLVDQSPLFGTSTLSATNFGTIDCPLLTTLSNSAVVLDSTGQIPIGQITSANGCSLSVSGGMRVFSSLVGIDGTSFFVTNGAYLGAPLATKITQVAGRNATLQSSGFGSVLDLPNVSTMSASGGISVNAKSGGSVKLPSLSSALVAPPGFDRGIGFNADGNLSKLEMTSFISLVDENIGLGPGSGFNSVNQGKIVLPALQTTTLSNSIVNASSKGEVTAKMLSGDSKCILSGDGVIRAPIQWAGVIRPGATIGRLVIDGGFTAVDKSLFDIQVNGQSTILHDSLAVNGGVSLSGTSLNVTLASGYLPNIGERIVIIDNDGTADPVTGTFKGLPQGSLVATSTNSVFFVVHYAREFAADSVGNNVVLEALPLHVLIQNGAAQRSTIRTVTVFFNQSVVISPSAFAVSGLSPTGSLISGVTVNATLNPEGTQATLTFSGPNSESGSVPDGTYTLEIDGDAITIQSNGQKLDCNGDGVPGGSYFVGFHRLFGDADGNGSVTAVDFNAFRLAFGTTGSSPFDFDGDNQVTAADFNQFRLRYGLTLFP
jgi:hypothetical protein